MPSNSPRMAEASVCLFSIVKKRDCWISVFQIQEAESRNKIFHISSSAFSSLHIPAIRKVQVSDLSGQDLYGTSWRSHQRSHLERRKRNFHWPEYPCHRRRERRDSGDTGEKAVGIVACFLNQSKQNLKMRNFCRTLSA